MTTNNKEINLKGRNFLTLLDYTPEEIRYLLDLSHELKEKKKNGIPHRYLEERILFYYLKKLLLEQDVLLKLLALIWVWALHTWILVVHKWVKKKALLILLKF